MLRRTQGEKVFNVFNIIILSLLLVATLYPFYYTVIASFSEGSAVVQGKVILYPVGFTLNAYNLIPTIDYFFTSYANTLFYTVFGGATSVVVMTLGAYALSRKQVKGRKLINIMISFTMWFNAGMVPFYMNMVDLHLENSRIGIIIGFACQAFYIFVLRNYFEGLPIELEEAAKIDGMGNFGIFLKVMLPLATPVLATIALYCAVDRWNGYFWAMILLKTQDLVPLQALLKRLIVELDVLNTVDSTGGYDFTRETLVYAIVVVAIIPIVAIYPFVQKFFIKGMTVGAVKG